MPSEAISNSDVLMEEISKFISSLKGNGSCKVIQKILKDSFLSIFSLLLLVFGLVLIVDDAGLLIPYLIYSSLGSVLVAAAVAHQEAYRKSFTCMEGMMLGMTIGMIAGFLFGAIVGATNGMFVGSVFGMAYGMLIGSYSGKCCGIMGVMEGLMAGLMGGTMGAMLSVMMVLDNLQLFLPILFASCTAIVFSLSVMINTVASNRAPCEVVSTKKFILVSLALALISFAIILFAPRSHSVIL